MPPCIRHTAVPGLFCRALCALLALGSFAAGAGAQRAAPNTPPDTLFVRGDILTGAHLRRDDKSSTPARVTALAVKGDRIVALGSDAEVLKLRGTHTTVVDLAGKFVMPGFNDAHTHMASAGQQRLAVNLVGASSLVEMQHRVGDYAASLPAYRWIQGGGWDHTLWASRTLPSRADLDAVSGGHPALLARVDGHIAVANSAALQAAGLTDRTPDPPGGKLDHDAAGHLTGILREAPAVALVEARIPKLPTEVRRRALQLSIDDALAHGVTSVQDFSDWEDWLVLESMEREQKLPLRFSEWMAFDQPVSVLEQRRSSHPAEDPLLHLGQLKAFTDGSLGSRTAALNAPYADDAMNSGIPRYNQAKLNTLASERAAAGFQLGFHAIGDRANDMALDAFAAASQAVAEAHKKVEEKCFLQHPEKRSWGDGCGLPQRPVSQSHRFRIEHAQVLSPGAFQRFAQLGVIASMQPSHLLTDMAWASDRLGKDRSYRAYAWRSLLVHRVTLAFGTDYPVESISPFRGLYAAVTRMNEAGTASFKPGPESEERLSITEALYAYTQASAFAEFREGTKGRLEPGFLADFVVLDRDLTKVAPPEILRTVVLRTVVGGQTRYEAPASAVPSMQAGR